MKTKRLLDTVERLIKEGQTVLATTRPEEWIGPVVDSAKFTKWLVGCRHLLAMLGNYAKPWSETFTESAEISTAGRAQRMAATLEAIKEAIQNDLLTSIESIVVAETFNSLLDQADYLAGEGYFLAGGVLGRAVLEEHLRDWCAAGNCVPAKPKPMANDFNTSLYVAKHYDVSVMKHVESMTALGNKAAHNLPGLQADEVARLLRDVREFLGKHPLP